MTDRLRDELASSTIVVAIVGPRWLRAADEFGYRRLDDPDDWVRCELGAALDDGKRILIVRAEDAVHPPAKALPEPLVRLASIQSTHRLHSASWPDDVNAIERLLAAWGLRDEEPDVRHARTGARRRGTCLRCGDRVGGAPQGDAVLGAVEGCSAAWAPRECVRSAA